MGEPDAIAMLLFDKYVLVIEVLGFVLRYVGDRFFGKCLAVEEPAVQQAVREALLYDLGCDGDYDAMGPRIHGLYPHTYPNPARL